MLFCLMLYMTNGLSDLFSTAVFLTAHGRVPANITQMQTKGKTKAITIIPQRNNHLFHNNDDKTTSIFHNDVDIDICPSTLLDLI